MIDKKISDQEYYKMKKYYSKKIQEFESLKVINGHAYFDLAEEVYNFSYELFCVLYPELVEYNEEPFEFFNFN